MEEFDEGEEEDNGQYSGVSAIELERKLHELLHARQQERIAELESTLKCVERKLVEKEIEARRWKDAARVASQNRDKTLVSIEIKKRGYNILTLNYKPFEMGTSILNYCITFPFLLSSFARSLPFKSNSSFIIQLSN